MVNFMDMEKEYTQFKMVLTKAILLEGDLRVKVKEFMEMEKLKRELGRKVN